MIKITLQKSTFFPVKDGELPRNVGVKKKTKRKRATPCKTKVVHSDLEQSSSSVARIAYVLRFCKYHPKMI